MPEKPARVTRRTFVKASAALATASALPLESSAEAPTSSEAVEARWLEGAPPYSPGATFGVAWPQGAHPTSQTFAVEGAGGAAIASQTWPLAFWPDGSLKWTAHALGALENPPASLRVVPGVPPTSPASPVTVTESNESVTVETGAIRATLPRAGKVFLSELTRAGKPILTDGRLVSLRSNAPELSEDGGTLRQQTRGGVVERVTVERSGPVRAVVKIEGKHGRWLPFVLRLYFTAGSEAVRIVHSFVYDGDERKDFLSGLGVRFTVPQTQPLHDRHVRFVGEGDGLFAEAVRPLTGLRRDPGAEARTAQVLGRPTPPAATFPDNVKKRLELIPAWGDFTLSQPTADGFEIRKRTKPGHAWVRAGAGRRAGGTFSLGGAVFGLRDFWQKYPSRLDIRGAHTERAEATLWLYSPDAGPMDLRFYHDGLGMTTHPQEREGLEITYEDYEKGWGTPQGVARTAELFLWALDATPTRERLNVLANVVRTPPQPLASPESLHASGAIWGWNLPDRSTPVRKAVEDQLDYLLALFLRLPEQNRWYGFWDFGDVMHSYDSDRHTWKYDIGGFAWANSELSPDLWLWFSALRTSRADVFRMAEAMTRHTSEVDVHHLGRFAGFGSRHNVQHWGDSSKQPRVGAAIYKRAFYFLTGDERTGDLLRELLEIDRQLLHIRIGRKLGGPPPPRVKATDHTVSMGFGTDWGAISSAWLIEWERTGDAKWRDRLVAGMESLAALPMGWLAGGSAFDLNTKRFIGAGDKPGISHLNAVFGAVETNAELLRLIPSPGYGRAWREYCTLYNAPESEKARRMNPVPRGFSLGEAHSRLTAYAAQQTSDDALATRAWAEFLAGGDGLGVRTDLKFVRIGGNAVLNPIDEGIGMSANASSQWGLAAIQNLALIGDKAPAVLPERRRR